MSHTPRLPGQNRPSTTRPGGDTGFWFGMAFILGSIAGFMAIITAVLPDAIFLFVVLFGFVAMIALHYFTWGRWLSNIVKSEDHEDDEPAWPEAPLPPDV